VEQAGLGEGVPQWNRQGSVGVFHSGTGRARWKGQLWNDLGILEDFLSDKEKYGKALKRIW